MGGDCRLGLNSSCRLGPDLFHVSPILLGPAGYLGHVLHVLRTKAPEVTLHLTSTFQAAADAMSANLPLDKASQTGKAEARGSGSMLYKEMQTLMTIGCGYREWWRMRT